MTNNIFDPENTLSGGLNDYTPRDVIELGIKLCEAASDAVGADGCHGGIWPGNISVSGGGLALGDVFRGSISDIGPDELEFVSPEQFWSGEGCPASDVYSIGIILYTALNEGVMPYFEKGEERTAEVRAAALQKRMNGGELPYPRCACRELGDVVLKAVEFRAEDRYPGTAALADALKSLPESANIAAVAPVIRLSRSERENAHSYKVDKEFEEIVPDKPKKQRRTKIQPDGVDENMDIREFRTTKKPLPGYIPLAIIIIVLAAVVLILRSCRNEPDTLIPDPTPTQTADIPAVVVTPDITDEPAVVETPEPTPQVTDKPFEERYVLTKADVSWTRAKELCETQGGHLATVSDEKELEDIISIAEEAGAQFVWLGSYRGEDGIWYNVTGETLTFAKWDVNEPSVMDGDGTKEDYMLLWYRPAVEKWSYNDMRNDPVSLLPRTYSGKIAYICEFD